MARWNKYKAKPVTIDGHRFASQKEGKRYEELKLLLAAGKIRNLRLQPRYPLKLDGLKICTYVADFEYQERADWWIAEDTKGFQTPVFKIKEKMFRALYPHIELRIL